MAEVVNPRKLSRELRQGPAAFLAKYWRQRKTKAVVVIVIAAGVAVLYKIGTIRSKRDRPIIERQRLERKRLTVDTKFIHRLKHLLSICIPSWRSRESVVLVLLTSLLLARTYLTISIAEIMGNNARALVEAQFSRFVRGVLSLGLIAVPASLVNSSLKYLTDLLALYFRKRLTLLCHDEYLQHLTFYKASNRASKLDHCDQRIATDIERFSTSVSLLYSSTFKPLVDVILFTRRLSSTVGIGGPLMMYVYYFISGVLLRSVMPSFAKLVSQQQHVEGNFRHAHQRIIANSEEIAFLGGGHRERDIANGGFDTVYRHTRSIFRRQGLVNIFDGWLVKYGATMVGYAVVALPVFGAQRSGADEMTTSARTQAYIRNTQLLINLARAIGQLVLLYKRIMTLAGYTARVSELMEVLHKLNTEQQSGLITAFKPRLESDQPPQHISGDIIAFEHVTLVAPDGTVLVSDISFEVPLHRNLLIIGPNGSGKSSLFRVLCELWPLQSGTVTKPAQSEIFYIPQKPYLTLGTLRDQLIYPHSVDEMLEGGTTDADLAKLLEVVGLSYLLRRNGGWSAVEDWGETLSGGEKQRIAMARLYYHRPRYAILDECTSGVAVDVEATMYEYCQQIGITLITVSHRKTLWKYHEDVLHFDGEGHWEFRPLSDDEKHVA